MIKLYDLVYCLDNMIDGFNYYYDTRDGTVKEIDMKYIKIADSYNEGDTLSTYQGWERYTINETLNFIRNYKCFVELPDRYDVDEFRIMVRFMCTRKRKSHLNKLTDALTGKGAIRKFKEVIKNLKIEQDWHDFKNNELMQIAISWCEKNGIEYECR